MAVIVKRSVTSGETDIVAQMLDLIYPVGSYYETSDTSFDPNISWGGTWSEDTAGKVLVAKDSGTFSTVGDTGGEETHTLTIDEIPSHTHAQMVTANPNPATGVVRLDYNEDKNGGIYPQGCDTGSRGGGQAHNNLQPYVVVKRWHRTA